MEGKGNEEFFKEKEGSQVMAPGREATVATRDEKKKGEKVGNVSVVINLKKIFE